MYNVSLLYRVHFFILKARWEKKTLFIDEPALSVWQLLHIYIYIIVHEAQPLTALKNNWVYLNLLF